MELKVRASRSFFCFGLTNGACGRVSMSEMLTLISLFDVWEAQINVMLQYLANMCQFG